MQYLQPMNTHKLVVLSQREARKFLLLLLLLLVLLVLRKVSACYDWN